MKLFGNTHRTHGSGNSSSTPLPTDKSRPKDTLDEDDQIIDDEYEEDLEEDFYGEDEDTDGEDYGEYDDNSGKKRLSTTKKVLIIGLSCLAAVLIGCGFFINYLLDLINYQRADSDYFVTVSSPEDLPEETAINEKLGALDEQEAASNLEATPEDLERWNNQIASITSDESIYEVPISEDVFNILLIGSDTRDPDSVGRSDAMILVSLNQKSKTIYLSSFLRDCYVYVPGYGNTRLNHAFAYGGPDLLMETLEENFKVHVDRYAAVDFFSFMDVIDILGGIWLYLDEDEVEITNDYIWSMNNLMDEDWDTDYIWTTGWMKLNGKQALCYARNRYTGNDYARTQRQRNIINQIINGAMDASPSTLVSLAQVILPQITTDLEKSEILSYAANVGAYLNYEVVSQQIPVEGTYSGATIDGMSVIRLDLDDNIEYLQGTIYAGTEYGTPLPSANPSTSTSPKPSASAAPTASTTPKPSASAQPSAKPTTSAKPSASIDPPGTSATTSPRSSDGLNERTQPDI